MFGAENNSHLSRKFVQRQSRLDDVDLDTLDPGRQACVMKMLDQIAAVENQSRLVNDVLRADRHLTQRRGFGPREDGFRIEFKRGLVTPLRIRKLSLKLEDMA